MVNSENAYREGPEERPRVLSFQSLVVCMTSIRCFLFSEDKEEEEDSEKEEVTESSTENSLMYTTAESENVEPPEAESSQEERAFSVITSAATAEPDASPVESVDHQPDMDETTNLPVSAVEQSTEDTKTDDADSVQETCDSDSLPQTYDLQDTIGEQESEQMEMGGQQNVDQNQSTVDQDQSTFDQGQSNDSSRSYSNSTYQETSEMDVLPKSKEEVRNLNEETMDVPASQDSCSQDNRNTFSGQNFITHKDDQVEKRSHVESESTPMEQVSTS